MTKFLEWSIFHEKIILLPFDDFLPVFGEQKRAFGLAASHSLPDIQILVALTQGAGHGLGELDSGEEYTKGLVWVQTPNAPNATSPWRTRVANEAREVVTWDLRKKSFINWLADWLELIFPCQGLGFVWCSSVVTFLARHKPLGTSFWLHGMQPPTTSLKFTFSLQKPKWGAPAKTLCSRS